MAESLSTPAKPSRKHRRGLTRNAAACERCRRRKQKCDSKVPICGPCEAAEATCVMSGRLTLQNPPIGDAEDLHAELILLRSDNERLKAELAAERRTTRESGVPSTDTAVSLPHTPPSRSRDRDRDSSIHRAYSGRILRPTFIARQGHRGNDSDILGSAWHLWNNDKSIETPIRATQTLEDIPMAQYGNELIETYFSHHWPHLPVLHKPTFLSQHYYPFAQGDSTSAYSEFLVYIVFAIAACGKKPHSISSVALSHRDFFQKAVGCLSPVMDAEDLDYIQCLLLLCAYGRNEPQSVNLWHTIGMALRTAVGLDLHRQESIAQYGLYDSEMAKRIFWSTYVLDRNIALALGRPLGIQDNDITVSLPQQYSDEHLIMGESDPVAPNVIPETTDTSTFIHVIKIRKINANIYSTFHAAGKSNSLEDMEASRMQYSRELSEWLITAPRYFTSTPMFQSPEWFQIAYHYALLSLHRPSYAVPVPSAESLRICTDSSISLISSYASLYARNRVSYSFIALNSIFMAAITMLYSLRASPFIRHELSKEVTETNIASCLSLFRGISNGREIADKCAAIVSRLGKVTLALFEGPFVSDEQIDIEFLTWFGLKSQRAQLAGAGPAVPDPGSQLQDEPAIPECPSVPSIDVPWHDFFTEGFDWETTMDMGFPQMAAQ